MRPPNPSEADPDTNAIQHPGRESMLPAANAHTAPEASAPSVPLVDTHDRPGLAQNVSGSVPIASIDACTTSPPVPHAEAPQTLAIKSVDASSEARSHKPDRKPPRKPRSNPHKKAQAENKRATRQRLRVNEGRKAFVVYVTEEQYADLRRFIMVRYGPLWSTRPRDKDDPPAAAPVPNGRTPKPPTIGRRRTVNGSETRTFSYLAEIDASASMMATVKREESVCGTI